MLGMMYEYWCFHTELAVDNAVLESRWLTAAKQAKAFIVDFSQYIIHHFSFSFKYLTFSGILSQNEMRGIYLLTQNHQL